MQGRLPWIAVGMALGDGGSCVVSGMQGTLCVPNGNPLHNCKILDAAEGALCCWEEWGWHGCL